jgi:FecR protein
MARSNLPRALVFIAAAFLAANVGMADTVLTQVSGHVEIGRGEPASWVPAHSGDVVAANDRVRTGADGRVEIKMDAATLRVHENSMLLLPAAVEDADRVELEEGRSLFDVLRREERRFEVHTPTVVVSVKGTRFDVDAGIDIGEVTVYRGTVGVREADAIGMVETLVREGFLATGGGGMPVEVDVSTANDPWQLWQEFGRAQIQDRTRPTRMGEMDRAKATLHRATAANVIMKAAERKPEVAQRLKELQKKQREKAQHETDDTGGSSERDRGKKPASRGGGPMPAAPDLGGEMSGAAKRKMLQQKLGNQARAIRIEEMKHQALDAQKVIDANRASETLSLEESIKVDELTGATGVSGNTLRFDFAAVYELSPTALLVLRDKLLDLQADYQSGTFVPAAPGDLIFELERTLISNGFTANEATKAVQTLIGN